MSDLFSENVKHGYYVWIDDKKKFIPSLPLNPLMQQMNNVPFEIRRKNVSLKDRLIQLRYECENENYEDLAKEANKLEDSYRRGRNRNILNRLYDSAQLDEWQLKINELRSKINKRKGL